MFFISSYTFFRTHRRELIEFLAKYKKIFVVCKMNESAGISKNITFINANISNASLNIFKIFHDFITAFKILKNTSEKKVFFVSTRLILIGILNSFLFRTKKFVYVFSGLGYLFISDNFLIKIIRSIYLLILKSSVSGCSSICIVQNQDDYDFFISNGLKEESLRIIYGNGIDHHQFIDSSSEKDLSIIKFLFVGRLLSDKGLIEFLDAAKDLANKYKNRVSIGIAGGIDQNNPANLNLDRLKENYESQQIRFFGDIKQNEVIKLYKEYNIFVLPSYREGLPRAAIEASLSAMPLILTEVPGCKECLEDGYNGFFIKIRSSKDIFRKMEHFVKNQEIIGAMGSASRKFSIEKFSGDKIFKEYLKILEE